MFSMCVIFAIGRRFKSTFIGDRLLKILPTEVGQACEGFDSKNRFENGFSGTEIKEVKK
jgi:hypothetical protein